MSRIEKSGVASPFQKPVDLASLVALRVLFGAILLASVLRFVAKGWVAQLYIEPRHHFTFYGFSWIPVWPAWGMYLHFAALALLALCIVVGWRTRLAFALFFLGHTYVELLEKAAYLNHYYLIGVLAFLLAFLPLGAAGSVDAKLNPRERADSVPVWMLWLVRFQLALVYVYAGVAKLHPDWLFRAEPMQTWLAANTEFPVIGPWLGLRWVAYAFAWAGTIFDLTIPLWLSLRRTRLLAYGALVGFHVMTGLLFPIGIFPWVMIGTALIFFPPDWPRRLGLMPPASAGMARDLAGPARVLRNACLTFLLALQVLLPLRHWLYPGDRMWTEEGFRFAWHVMVKQKTGMVDFTATDPQTGQAWLVNLHDYLTPFQIQMMSTEPDMILECAQWIAEDFRQRGHLFIEVRAEAYASLNGRPSQLLIDPKVDLSRERPGFGPKPWIFPLNATSPARN